MLRRTLTAASIAGVVASFAAPAHGAGAWVAQAAFAPVEQRVAISVGPDRTTLWTSLRFTAAAGPVAIVVPAPPGASLDLSSDAWFESLELATAPRIFPPLNADPYCPGKSGPMTVFELAGQASHVASLTPADVSVLDDVAGVNTWLTDAGLTMPTSLAAALSAMSGSRFVGVRYLAPGGDGVTPTLRVAMPGGPPSLPLAITRAGTDDLKVTAWTLGTGLAGLSGGDQVIVPVSALAWNADSKSSNYEDQRASVLANDAQSFVTESASTESLAQDVSIASGKATIPGVVGTYFVDAAKYGDGNFDSATCIAQAGTALASHSKVAASCPHAALGVVDSAPPCAEAPGPGEVDPAQLRCGAGADDLAVALSGLVPATTWLTRTSLEIPHGATGTSWTLDFGAGAELSPALRATSVDFTDCGGLDGGTDGGMQTSSSSHGSSGSGSSTGTGPHGFNTYGGISIGAENGSGSSDWVDVVDDFGNTETNCGCTGTQNISVDIPESSTPSADTSCNTETAGSSDTCSGDGSTTSDACAGDSSSDTCSGSSGSSDTCSGSSGSSESCSGSSGGESCSGGSSGSLCTASPRAIPRPKLSVVMMAALALLAPLRRRARANRRTAKGSRAAR